MSPFPQKSLLRLCPLRAIKPDLITPTLIHLIVLVTYAMMALLVLVTLESESDRKEILDAASSADINPVKIKKDQHPALRKEWRRLFQTEADEKNKPENAGCVIKLDRKQRLLLRDGVVIDRFLPNF